MQLPIYDKNLEILEEAERRFDVLPLSDENENSAKKWDSFFLAQTMKRARSRQKQLKHIALLPKAFQSRAKPVPVEVQNR